MHPSNGYILQHPVPLRKSERATSPEQVIPTYRGLRRIGPGRSHRGTGRLWYQEGLAAIEYSLA